MYVKMTNSSLVEGLLDSPYLRAIQDLPGNTQNEKQRFIVSTAINYVKHQDSKDIERIPPLLKPILDVHIGRLSKDRQAIVQGLQSTDVNVWKVATKAKWFFEDASPTSLEQLLPVVPMKVRKEMIKQFGRNLKSEDAAEAFFSMVVKLYGAKEGNPLLLACKKSFIESAIVKYNVIFSPALLNHLFTKHPDIVIDYLLKWKLTDDTDDIKRITKSPNLRYYNHTLYKIFDQYFDKFLEVTEAQGNLDMKLGRKRSKVFLAKGKDFLIKNPQVYKEMFTSDEILFGKLSDAELNQLLSNLLPKKVQDFSFHSYSQHFASFTDDSKKIQLIQSLFKEKYNLNLIECKSKLTPELLQLLPKDQRVAASKLLLEGEDSWTGYSTNECWPCYHYELQEVIANLKERVSNCNMDYRRGEYLEKMVFACKVNNDAEELVEVLRYIHARHRNEQSWIKDQVFQNLGEIYDLRQLPDESWAVVEQMVAYSKIQGEMDFYYYKKYYLCKIQRNFERGLSIDEVVDAIVVACSDNNWGRRLADLDFKDFEKIEALFLKKLIERLPARLETDEREERNNRLQLIVSFVELLSKYNEKVKKKSPKKYEKISFAGSKLVTCIEDYCNDSELVKSENSTIRDLKMSLYGLEPEVFAEIVDSNTKAIYQLTKNFHKELVTTRDHWNDPKFVELFFGKFQDVATFKTIKWYQTIPLRIIDHFTSKDSKAIGHWDYRVMAIFTDGSTLTKVLEPLQPLSAKVDIESTEAKEQLDNIKTVMSCVHLVNPPPPVMTIEPFVKGDFLHHCLSALAHLVENISPVQVMKLSNRLIERETTVTETKKTANVTVLKVAVRQVCRVSTIDEINGFLDDLRGWQSFKSSSGLRNTVGMVIYSLFKIHADDRTWRFLAQHIEQVEGKQDYTFMNKLTESGELTFIPDEFLTDYLKLCFDKFENSTLDQEGKFKLLHKMIAQMDKKVCSVIDEDFMQSLINNYLFCANYRNELINVEMAGFVIFSYLGRGDNEKRILFVKNSLEELIRQHWDSRHEEMVKFSPVRYVFNNFVDRLSATIETVQVSLVDRLLELFDGGVLDPIKEPGTYILLKCCKIYKSTDGPRQFGAELAKSRDVFHVFPSEYLSEAVKSTEGFYSGIGDYEKQELLDTTEARLLAIFEGFFEAADSDGVAQVVAALMFKRIVREITNEKYLFYLRKFSQMNNLSVTCILRQLISTMSFDDCKVENSL